MFIGLMLHISLGVVLCEDKFTNEFKCYIDGIASQKEPNSEIVDAQKVIQHGAYFPLEAAKVLFKHLDFNKSWVKTHPEYFL